MKSELDAKSAAFAVLLYLALSILAGLFAAIYFCGIRASGGDRNIDGVIDSGMIWTVIVLIVLVFISLFVFSDSRKDIFFERKRFDLSKRYYLFPLTWFGVALFALFNVEFSAYSARDILLVLLSVSILFLIFGRGLFKDSTTG